MSVMNGRGVAKSFWEKSEVYPEYGTINERRLYELNYLVPRLKNCSSFLDLGCGDGALLSCLKRLTKIKKYYGFDISENLLKHVDSDIETKVYDCYKHESLPKTDVTLIGGVFPFLFEDDAIDRLLAEVTSPILFLRTTCTLHTTDELVQTYSEKLKSDYSARYLTVPHVIELLNKRFRVDEVMRIYPDEIESEFGTKQFYFKGVLHEK